MDASDPKTAALNKEVDQILEERREAEGDDKDALDKIFFTKRLGIKR